MDFLVDSIPLLVTCAIAFVAGGVVKGAISIGLPVVGLPFLTLVTDVRTAVGLLMVPLLVSNLVQAFEGKGTWAILRRFWLLTVAVVIGIFIGTGLLVILDPKVLLLVVGAFSIAASLVMVLTPSLAIPSRAEPWLAIPIGLAAGVIGGMSTLIGPLLTIYIIGLKLDRDAFVKAISLLFMIAAASLLVGAVAHGAASPATLGLSSLCMVPVYAGMLIGRRIRQHLQPATFYRVVLAAVFLGGINMVRQGLGF